MRLWIILSCSILQEAGERHVECLQQGTMRRSEAQLEPGLPISLCAGPGAAQLGVAAPHAAQSEMIDLVSDSQPSDVEAADAEVGPSQQSDLQARNPQVGDLGSSELAKAIQAKSFHACPDQMSSCVVGLLSDSQTPHEPEVAGSGVF